VAAQFCGSLQYLLTLCLFLLTVDVYVLFDFVLAIYNSKLLSVNFYMPYENDSVSTEEFAKLLSVCDDLIITYSDYIVVIGGDFKVDFSRD